MSARPPNSPALLVLIFVAAIALANGCGGREDASDGTDAAATPTPSAAAVDPGAAPAATGQLAMTPEQREQLRLYAEQQRKARGPSRPKVFRIDPAQGEEAIALPEDFPVDVPLPPNSTATGYVSSSPGGTMTTLVVDETLDSATRFYSSALEGEGWEVAVDGGTSELMMISAEKGSRTLVVAVAVENGVTTVTLLEDSL